MTSALARNDPTLLAKSNPAPHRRGGALADGQSRAWAPGPPTKRNWLGKNEWVTRNRKHGGGAWRFARGQICAKSCSQCGSV
jgi:hypothetical protein